MFSSTGKLKPSIENGSFKLIVEVDPEISNYYRSLIPKYLKVNRPRYAPHISVVRWENPKYQSWNWVLMDNYPVDFRYDGFIHHDDVYFWLAVECEELQQLRKCLFLPETSEITRSPNGKHNFHITIGNSK